MAARYTDEQIIQALTATNGLVYAAAKRLGCSAVTIYARIDKSAKVKEALDQQRGVMIDMAEAALMKAVGEGEGWAVCFLLKTIGKSRGYVERQEVTGANGGAIETKDVSEYKSDLARKLSSFIDHRANTTIHSNTDGE